MVPAPSRDTSPRIVRVKTLTWITSDRGVAVVLLALSAGLLAHGIVAAFPYTTDDSYVVFRYAQNLAAGNGATFNAGQTPVEGYTTFLWMLLMAVPHALGLNAVIFAKVAGIACTIGLVMTAAKFTWCLSLDESRDRRALLSSFTVALLCAPFSTSVHAVSGMGTALIALLLTALLYRTTRLVSDPTPRGAIVVALLALLAGLTRPDANIVAVVGMVAAAVMLPRERRSALLWSAVVFYVLPGAVYFWWRTKTYGHLFPLPFYVKVVHQRVLSGLPDVVQFSVYIGLHLGILIILGFRRLPWAAVPALAAGWAGLLFFVFPAHYVSFASRYLFPLTPLCAVVAARGLGNLLALLELQARSGERAGRLGAFLIASLVVAGQLTDFSRLHAESSEYALGMRRAHERLGNRLRLMRRERPLVLATSEAGRIPYLSGWQTIDAFGLNDALIATTWSHDPALVVSRHPDLVVVASRSDTDFIPANGAYEEALLHRCLQDGMAMVGSLMFKEGSYYLWLLAWPGSQVAEGLKEW